MKGWTGVDLDGTLAQHDGWRGSRYIGPPIPKMLARVKKWLKQGRIVKIFTARANDPDAIPAIKAWCREHIGQELEITATKDYSMFELWDDRAIQVIPNTGERVDRHLIGHALARIEGDTHGPASTPEEEP